MPVVIQVGQTVGALRSAEVIGEVISQIGRRRPVGQIRERGTVVGIQERTRIRNEAGRSSGLLIAEAGCILIRLYFVLPVRKESQLADGIVVDELEIDLIA